MNKVKVTVNERQYAFQTAESPTLINTLAAALEKKVNEFTDQGASQLTANVLVSLSLMDDLANANKKNDELIDTAKGYVDEAGKARAERDAAVKENEDLKQKTERLEKENKILSEKIEKIEKLKKYEAK